MAIPKLFDLARMSTATTGTGTITLGSAISGFLTFANAGVVDADTVRYAIADGANSEVGYGVYTASGTTLTRNVIKSTNSNNAISLSGGAIVMIGATAEDFYDRAPFDAMTCRNLAINGNVDISQELGTTGATLVNNTIKYIADMWAAKYNHGGSPPTPAVFTGAQGASNIGTSGTFVSGSPNCARLQSTTALSSIANGDFANLNFKIEGYDTAPLGWGTAAAQPISIGFWTLPNVSGGTPYTLMLRVTNSAGNRAYHKEFTIATALNQWQTMTIPGDTSGSWLGINNTGIVIDIFSAGKEATPATPNAWGTTPKVQSTNQTANPIHAQTNGLFGVTGLIVVAGSEVPTADRAPFCQQAPTVTLERCKRYWWHWKDQTSPIFVAAGICATTTLITVVIPNPVEMRANPAFTPVNKTNFKAFTGANNLTSVTDIVLNGTAGIFSSGLLCTSAAMTVGAAMLFTNNTNCELQFDARMT